MIAVEQIKERSEEPAIATASADAFVMNGHWFASLLSPVAALYVSLGLVLVMGAIIGAMASWLACRKYYAGMKGRHAE